ncbi:penicillin-binding protein 2 [Candidatus Peregrinibacteria bacterium]|jgi:stage V sporulation protein D (sporulation-specific penicillin-binding protein)|nr:penicillin-binding protein 2 [Candidatus Peregrinibacteria bacterium]MBT7484604.1 penicillin-binding protein 2 [Candidatus Peregrinibacteria bacterium]MBT7702704.1 penicillin-binding protein 2 [Candidatus Peregrinibacteria bacterium]
MKTSKNLFKYRRHFRELPMNRITILVAFGFVTIFAILLQLFFLQVIKSGYYQQIAFEKNQGYTEIPARRGEILIQDRNSDEPYSLATNTTFKLVYADPTLIEDPTYIGETLAPLLFDLEEEQERDQARYENLLKEYQKTFENLGEMEDADEEEEEATEEETTENEAELNLEELLSYTDLKLHTDEELFILFKQELINTLSEKTRSVILLTEKLDPITIESLENLHLTGIEVTENGTLYAYPSQISNKESTAKKLAEVLEVDKDNLESVLLGRNRYVILKRKLPHDISQQIETLQSEQEKEFFGIRMQEEYYRYYPEGELGAQLLGYVNAAGNGQYGIESTFESELEGETGYFTSQIDASGKQITVGDSEIQEAVDGSNVMLTIDRTIQSEAEKVLAKGVEDFQADSGLIIVQEPSTGRILAMAHYPTFDPNDYSEAYALEEIDVSDEEEEFLYRVGEGENERIYLYIRTDPDQRIELFYDEEKDEYYKYKNLVGPEVYQLKAVTLPYEPGSVFKPVAMAAAIDAGEVTPFSTFYSNGPVQVDEYEIHTFNDIYYGTSTMTEVLIHSDNTGMVYIAQKLGSALFYDYLQAFGFTEKTHIEFENEHSGVLEYYDYWADSELVTKAFGQGISVTPIQLITSISALANGGLLMQPYIIDYIEEADGRRNNFDPEIVRRVITEETANEVTAMMTAVVEQGAPLAALDNHYVAGKTGTAQTYKWGKALSGRGTTITSFVGFAPIDDPQFTVLVKMDRPKTVEWGAATAGPVFNELAEFLVSYYNVPPDKTS